MTKIRSNLAVHLPLTRAACGWAKKEFHNRFFVISPSDSLPKRAAKTLGNAGKKSLVVLCISIASLTLPLFALFDFFFRRISRLSPVNKDCYRILNSPIFNAYFEQLQEFVKERLKIYSHIENLKGQNLFIDNGLKLIHQILKKPKKNFKERLYYHQTMIHNLRALIKEKNKITNPSPEEMEMCHFIDDLTQWKYTSPKLWGEVSTFMNNEIGFGKICSLNKTNSAKIEEIFSVINNKRNYFGIVEPKNGRLYDPHLLGDIPFILFSSLDKKTRFIRTPNVTKDVERDFNRKRLLKSEVTEEFTNYLRSSAIAGNRHLYVNLMFRTGRSEQIRSREIEALETSQEVGDAIDVVTLDKNSYFYNQENMFSRDLDSQSFISKFLFELFENHEDRRFFWPKRLNLSEWKVECRSILDAVNQKYFQKKEILSQEERKDFIEIAYIKIIQALIKKFTPKICNVACLSTIDRGACTLSLIYFDQLVETGKSKENGKIKKLASLALAPALLAQNRPTQSERVHRLTNAMSRIEQNLKN